MKRFFHNGQRWRWKRVIFSSITLLLVVIIVGAVAFFWPSTATAEAQEALNSNSTVNISNNSDTIIFQPKEALDTGFIFYPGARVDPVAYTRYMKPLAEQGYTVIVVKMPLNLAILGQNNAEGAINNHPDVKNWVIGGHSLGGVMACRYTADHPDQIKGLLLYASYCETDLSKRTDLTVATLYATNDTLSTKDEIMAAQHFLPGSAFYIPIDGAIHSFFGDYGAQRGDGEATITHEQAREEIIEHSLLILGSIQ